MSTGTFRFTKLCSLSAHESSVVSIANVRSVFCNCPILVRHMLALFRCVFDDDERYLQRDCILSQVLLFSHFPNQYTKFECLELLLISLPL